MIRIKSVLYQALSYSSLALNKKPYTDLLRYKNSLLEEDEKGHGKAFQAEEVVSGKEEGMGGASHYHKWAQGM